MAGSISFITHHYSIIPLESALNLDIDLSAMIPEQSSNVVLEAEHWITFEPVLLVLRKDREIIFMAKFTFLVKLSL